MSFFRASTMKYMHYKNDYLYFTKLNGELKQQFSATLKVVGVLYLLFFFQVASWISSLCELASGASHRLSSLTVHTRSSLDSGDRFTVLDSQTQGVDLSHGYPISPTEQNSSLLFANITEGGAPRVTRTLPTDGRRSELDELNVSLHNYRSSEGYGPNEGPNIGVGFGEVDLASTSNWVTGRITSSVASLWDVQLVVDYLNVYFLFLLAILAPICYLLHISKTWDMSVIAGSEAPERYKTLSQVKPIDLNETHSRSSNLVDPAQSSIATSMLSSKSRHGELAVFKSTSVRNFRGHDLSNGKRFRIFDSAALLWFSATQQDLDRQSRVHFEKNKVTVIQRICRRSMCNHHPNTEGSGAVSEGRSNRSFGSIAREVTRTDHAAPLLSTDRGATSRKVGVQLTELAVLTSWRRQQIKERIAEQEVLFFTGLLIVVSIIVCLSFLVVDYFYFFILFELSMVPLILIIGRYGSQTSKIHSTFLTSLAETQRASGSMSSRSLGGHLLPEVCVRKPLRPVPADEGCAVVTTTSGLGTTTTESTSSSTLQSTRNYQKASELLCTPPHGSSKRSSCLHLELAEAPTSVLWVRSRGLNSGAGRVQDVSGGVQLSPPNRVFRMGDRVKAAYYFFFYTFLASIFFLLGILLLWSTFGTSNLFTILLLSADSLAVTNVTSSAGTLHFSSFASNQVGSSATSLEYLLWFCFFLPLAVKLPMVPLHGWLPEAHVESPTEGSVLLAGLLLKVGGYGLIRYLLLVWPLGTQYFTPLILMLATISVVYTTFVIWRQVDLKKIIAYFSVSHMNLAVLGLFSGTVQGVHGCLMLFITHGIVSSGLFIAIGLLYQYYHSRLVCDYRGLSTNYPLLSGAVFVLMLANFAFPGTASFIAELLIFLGVFQHLPYLGIICFVGIILGTVYSILIYTKMFFGVSTITPNMRASSAFIQGVPSLRSDLSSATSGDVASTTPVARTYPTEGRWFGRQTEFQPMLELQSLTLPIDKEQVSFFKKK